MAKGLGHRTAQRVRAQPVAFYDEDAESRCRLIIVVRYGRPFLLG
jgi:hypothetical protein